MQINIYDYMTHDLKLSGADLLVYAAINAYMEHGFCNTTQYQIAEAVNLGLRTVTRSFANLKDKKLINITKYWDGGQKRNYITIHKDIDGMNNCYRLDNFIELWKEYFGIDVKKSLELYKIYSSHNDKDSKYYSDVLEGLAMYANIINDKNYYKSHICSFAKFLDSKYKDYLPNGCESQEYHVFRIKNGFDM